MNFCHDLSIQPPGLRRHQLSLLKTTYSLESMFTLIHIDYTFPNAVNRTHKIHIADCSNHLLKCQSVHNDCKCYEECTALFSVLHKPNSSMCDAFVTRQHYQHVFALSGRAKTWEKLVRIASESSNPSLSHCNHHCSFQCMLFVFKVVVTSADTHIPHFVSSQWPCHWQFFLYQSGLASSLNSYRLIHASIAIVERQYSSPQWCPITTCRSMDVGVENISMSWSDLNDGRTQLQPQARHSANTSHAISAINPLRYQQDRK